MQNRLLIILICVVAVAGLTMLYASLSYEAVYTTSRASDALDEWEKKELASTMAWRIRSLLSQLSWLGSIRPAPPKDPFAECGVTADRSCYNYPLMSLSTKKLLSCLEETMQEVEEEHTAFEGRLHCSAYFIFGAVLIGVMMLVKHSAHLWRKTGCNKPLKAASKVRKPYYTGSRRRKRQKSRHCRRCSLIKKTPLKLFSLLFTFHFWRWKINQDQEQTRSRWKRWE